MGILQMHKLAQFCLAKLAAINFITQSCVVRSNDTLNIVDYLVHIDVSIDFLIHHLSTATLVKLYTLVCH